MLYKRILAYFYTKNWQDPIIFSRVKYLSSYVYQIILITKARLYMCHSDFVSHIIINRCLNCHAYFNATHDALTIFFSSIIRVTVAV